METMHDGSLDARTAQTTRPAQQRHQEEVKTFPKFESVTSPTVGTEDAAYYLNRKPQTLRIWACQENGPIHPIRINGRLAWSVATLRKLVGGAA